MATTARDELHEHQDHESNRRGRPGLKGRLADREVQIDVVAAALIGAAIGISATLLMRPRRRNRFATAARRAARRGETLWNGLPDSDELRGRFSEYVNTARDTIDRAVDHELKALRKRLEKERSRLHL